MQDYDGNVFMSAERRIGFIRATPHYISQLDSDDALSATLCAKGPGQAKKFSQTAHQIQLAEMYDRVLSHSA